jgi:hypothetical protein
VYVSSSALGEKTDEAPALAVRDCGPATALLARRSEAGVRSSWRSFGPQGCPPRSQASHFSPRAQFRFWGKHFGQVSQCFTMASFEEEDGAVCSNVGFADGRMQSL